MEVYYLKAALNGWPLQTLFYCPYCITFLSPAILSHVSWGIFQVDPPSQVRQLFSEGILTTRNVEATAVTQRSIGESGIKPEHRLAGPCK